jgi:hypothetical protein
MFYHRRRFLADVGSGMLIASVGATLAGELGLASAHAAEDSGERLTFGSLEPLVDFMQRTPADKLLPEVVARLKNGVELRSLVAAAALANARAFGGQDYVGFHTFMALAPALAMSQELPERERPLPVLKVLHRNAERLQASGKATEDTLQLVQPTSLSSGGHVGEQLRRVLHEANFDAAERSFASLADSPADDLFNHWQYALDEEAEVHRVVLAWRAWDTLGLTGQEHAHTMLRQSVRFCVEAEQRISGRQSYSPVRKLLPKLLDEHKLLDRPLGSRRADDAWLDRTANELATASREQGAQIAAAALAEGFAPADVAEAISLAANQLVLRDPGRPPEWASAQKPAGSVHGDSIGVHASDSANAWRNIARVSNHRNTVAALIVGAFHTAGQSGRMNAEQYPLRLQVEEVTASDPAALLKELDGAIREGKQLRACAIATRYGEIADSAHDLFRVLLRYAISEEGALHAEKYFRTVQEEFAVSRQAYRWRHMAALARVTASQFGYEAPGYALAKELVG